MVAQIQTDHSMDPKSITEEIWYSRLGSYILRWRANKRSIYTKLLKHTLAWQIFFYNYFIFIVIETQYLQISSQKIREGENNFFWPHPLPKMSICVDVLFAHVWFNRDSYLTLLMPFRKNFDLEKKDLVAIYIAFCYSLKHFKKCVRQQCSLSVLHNCENIFFASIHHRNWLKVLRFFFLLLIFSAMKILYKKKILQFMI